MKVTSAYPDKTLQIGTQPATDKYDEVSYLMDESLRNEVWSWPSKPELWFLETALATQLEWIGLKTTKKVHITCELRGGCEADVQ